MTASELKKRMAPSKSMQLTAQTPSSLKGEFKSPWHLQGGYYPVFPSLPRTSAALICPTLVIIDIPLHLTRIILALSLLWSSREDAILNQDTSQNSSWWAAEPPWGEAHGDALTTESILNLSCSVESGTYMWGPCPSYLPAQHNCFLLQSDIPVPSLHSSRYFRHFQVSMKRWLLLTHPCLNILHPIHISLGNPTGGGLALM